MKSLLGEIPPVCTELFHAQDEEAEWTESRVVTLIDTLPPGSPQGANQGWIGGARSQAQVWCVFSSFSVIALLQSVLITLLLPANPSRACSFVNPTVACHESPAWDWKEETLIHCLSSRTTSDPNLCAPKPSRFSEPVCSFRT